MSPVPDELVGEDVDLWFAATERVVVGTLLEVTPYQYVVRCAGPESTTTWRIDRAAVVAIGHTTPKEPHAHLH